MMIAKIVISMFLVFSLLLSPGCTGGNGNTIKTATEISEAVELETTTEPTEPGAPFEEPAEISLQELAVRLDEKTNMYQFTYKKSVLNMSKEKFDEYNLANDNIQKFFDAMEKVYVLFADFFIVHNLPDIFTYNSITDEYRESMGAKANSFAIADNNATYYVEGLLEGYLQNIDIGFSGIVGHEVGHLFTAWTSWDEKNSEYIAYNGVKYVWDLEVFATIAMEYLVSLPDFNVINVYGDPRSVLELQRNSEGMDGYEEWFKTYQGFIYFKILTIAEKYGYDTLHEVLSEMTKKNTNTNRIDPINLFNMFFDIYAEKTGENLKEKYFAPEELFEIYENIRLN
jgi:hypothetical protein